MGKKKNKRGNGSIHLRKDGRWEGRVVIGAMKRACPKPKMSWREPAGSARKSSRH